MYTVRMILPARRSNPDYDPSQPGSPVNLEVPVGEVIEHPDAWKLCLPEFKTGDVRAEPADEVTTAKVDAEMKIRADKIAAREKQEQAAYAARKAQRQAARKAKQKVRRPAK